MSDSGEILARALDQFVDLISQVEGHPCAVVLVYVEEGGGCPSVLANTPVALDILQFCVDNAGQSDDEIIDIGEPN